jgi:drug/metabolite transporter (DMT)-like permease
VLNAATPLFTTLLASLALAEERLPASRALGVVVGFVGVVVIVGPFGGGANPLTTSVPGQLACLGAAACYGAGFTYTRRFLANHGHSPLALAAGQLGCGAALLWLAAPVVADAPLQPQAVAVAAVTALGLLGTGLAYLVYYRLLGELGAIPTSTAIYLVPVVAVGLGVVVLGEPVTASMVVGAAIVFAGVAIVQRRVRRAPPPAAVTGAGGPPVAR